MANIKYDVVKHIGAISNSSNGWSKELNYISWNDRDPKYDIRDWDSENGKMGKGITLTKDELKSLKDLLNEMEL